jgi:pyridoxamine 5'-phosphate oxidase
MMEEIAGIRSEYLKGVLSENDVDTNPYLQFEAWMDEALKSQVLEPTAMVLATVEASGRPAARMVLLKGFDTAGFQFYTNYNSRKAGELAANPKASLLFFWKELERQVRIEGVVEKLTDAESDAYFASRPRESQIGAWVSPQSHVIDNRTYLDQQLSKVELDFLGKEVTRPQHWGGYRLKPDYFEFWQGRLSRLHDRISYILQENGQWMIHRLAP